MSKKGFDQTIAWYNKNAKLYAHTLSGRARLDNIDLFLTFLPKNAKILDAGCAGGRDAAILFEKGYQVVGVDIAEGLIQVARETYPEIFFVQGDLLQLPFQDQTFDGVWSQASLVHLPTPEDTQQAIFEFARVLKPKGILYLYVKAQLGQEKTAIKTDTLSEVPRFFRYYTQQELIIFLTKAGLSIIKNDRQEDLGKRPGVEWILIIARKN